MKPEHVAREIEKWDRYYASVPDDAAEDASVQRFHDELMECITALLPEGGRILEAGCGAGRHSLALARLGRYQVGLLDFSSQALRHARALFQREQLRADFFQGGAHETGSPEYDLVFNAGVLEHHDFDGQVSLLRGMASRSRKYVLVIVPNRFCYWYWIWRIQLTADGGWPFGRELPSVGLSDVFRAAGLRLVGHRFLGTSWTEDFISGLHGLPEHTRHRLLEVHRSGTIPLRQRAYLVGALGSVASEATHDVDGWSSFEYSVHASTSGRSASGGGHGAELNSAISDMPALSDLGDLPLLEKVAHELQFAQHGLAQFRASTAFRIAQVAASLPFQRRAPHPSGTPVHVAQFDSLAAAATSLHNAARSIAIASGSIDVAPFVAAEPSASAPLTEGSSTAVSAIDAPQPDDALGLAAGPESPSRPAGRPSRSIISSYRSAVRSLSERARQRALREINRFRTRRELRRILELHPGRPIVVSPPLVDWNIPIFQRPQHIALQLARRGFLYFYCTPNARYDHVAGFEELAEGCYITDRFEDLVTLRRPKTFHIYSTDLTCSGSRLARSAAFLDNQIADGNSFLYEYIDEIHRDISRQEIPSAVFQRHARILQDESIPVVATATRLYDEVRRHRTRNLALVTNGVDLQHFSLRRTEPPPAELQPILARKKPIIGYFGALAAWFDYELVLRVARERDYEVVLLGHDYDHSLQAYALNSQPNLHRLGPVPYSRLPSYACWFDVSTIPFRRNVITESTSPIKLFEYMALGTPIVATDIPECRKYRSVLIGHDADEFLRRLDEALMLRSDPGYCSQLSQDAVANTWESKAAMIADLLRL